MKYKFLIILLSLFLYGCSPLFNMMEKDCSYLLCFFYKAGTHAVYIYDSPYSNIHKVFVKDDIENERWTFVNVIRKKGSRFFVSLDVEDSQSIKGWIDCKECAVYLYPNERYKNNSLRFYKRPRDNDLYCSIEYDYLEEGGHRRQLRSTEVQLVDYDKETGRAQVIVEFVNGKVLSLWTSDFCNNIYGCEGN